MPTSTRRCGAVELDALADLPAAYLSAGQRRRLSIARLVAVPRPLWLLDEPTAALDAAAQTRFAALMRDASRRRRHDPCRRAWPDRLAGAQRAAVLGGAA